MNRYKPVGWRYESYRHSLAARKIVLKKGKYHSTLSGPEVYALANRVKKKLDPVSNKIDIAGSIRRNKPDPVDVDIVMIPKKSKEDVKKILLDMGAKVESEGSTTVQTRIDGVDVDVYFAKPEDYGAQLMTRTGPWQGNIGNRTLAKNRGMLLNQYGLYKNGRRIAGRTEKEIYEKLGKKYKDPSLRGK